MGQQAWKWLLVPHFARPDAATLIALTQEPLWESFSYSAPQRNTGPPRANPGGFENYVNEFKAVEEWS
ncbi:hypothetical protein ACIQPR_09340 [Streptomyces sp. NPDC091280]|uniref:hypothetical protein n=1 Tax=Streptomyces sp. NPDC091280 TaxID=3365984 RepID=UPI0037FA7485